MSLYDVEVTTIDGTTQTLAPWRGQVLLIVNVASECGFTPQYAGLEALYRAHRDRGFAVLGFPCDQFGHQEPGAEDEIKSFCEPSKATIILRKAASMAVSAARPFSIISRRTSWWNFTKFLVGQDGSVLRRYATADTPEQIDKDLEPLIAGA
jgi:glutathione peroxidase